MAAIDIVYELPNPYDRLKLESLNHQLFCSSLISHISRLLRRSEGLGAMKK
jgi:hypothetical protein